jgi:predicted homoserine dehydrogenase-like protein
MNLHSLANARLDKTGPIRVGLIGAGKFGAMFLAQARLIPSIQVTAISDLKIDRIESALERTGWPAGCTRVAERSDQVHDARAAGAIAATQSVDALIEGPVDVVIECTGAPEPGAQHALKAIDAGRHVVMVTVEADVLIGPIIRQRADRAGVVYSMAYGDQPALVCELVDWARMCGFDVVAAGKGTKHLPEYHYSTPETVFGYYGFTAEQVAGGDFNPRMFNSFLDGTKSAIEMAAIANATGLTPQPDGLKFPSVGVGDLANVLKPESAGGMLSHGGTVEVVSSLRGDGSEMADHLRWGVYVTIEAATEYVRGCFSDYGLTTDESGRYAAMYRPSHLVGLELPISVASAALRNEATGSPREFVGDVAAVAKRNLTEGEVLDGEGGETVFGRLMPAGDSVASGALPIGLASGVAVARPVTKDGILTYDDVRLEEGGAVLAMRRELERSVGRE